MVVRAFQENVDLVADDYYAREIAYEDKQKQMANLEALDVQAAVTLQDGEVWVQFPHRPASGQVHFYHVSRQALDRTFDITTDAQHRMSVSRSELASGNYRVNLTWTRDGREYFQQARLFIQ